MSKSWAVWWHAMAAAAVCFGCFANTPDVARADSPAEARVAFEAGVAASRAGRWSEARDHFKRSLAMLEKPSTHFNLAVAEVKLGLGRDALASLDAFERSANPRDHADMLARVPALRSQAQALARKQEPERPDPEPGELPGLRGEARALFIAGREAYAAGRYPQALEYFERAHALSERPELLYDIGAAADSLRLDERAIEALRAFVAAVPDAPQVPAARARIAVLEKALAEHEPAPPAPPHTTPDDGPPAPPPPVATEAPSLAGPRSLIVVGAAALAGAGGSAFGWNERAGKYDKCAEAPDCTNRDQIQRQKRAVMGATLGLGALGVGLITGGSVWLARAKRAARPRTSAHFELDAHHVLLGLHGVF